MGCLKIYLLYFFLAQSKKKQKYKIIIYLAAPDILKLNNKIYLRKLNSINKKSVEIQIKKDDKIVIFSDMHLGNGKRNDDFKKNSDLFHHVLKNYYLKKNYTLILNGDIEELLRTTYQKIKKRWHSIYQLFDKFNQNKKLYKIFGNHDFELRLRKDIQTEYNLYESIKLDYNGNKILVFHGHQILYIFEKFNFLVSFVLKYIANPFGIKNYTLSMDNKKKIILEEKIHDYSRKNEIISIIGHTHRPLFESLSKYDFVRFKIEECCRKYVNATEKQKKKIEKDIIEYKNELVSFSKDEIKKEIKPSLYTKENLLLPCLFNSGCCIGKRGITSIEISDEFIYLVHWFDKNKNKKYINYHKNKIKKLSGSDYYRIELNSENLDYIFTRIKLLT
ncbi:MAG: metallophosphoesterase [Spirochaetes bacterium]|nr:metallophosphoesterase [Spirochaetota bacterium]